MKNLLLVLTLVFVFAINLHSEIRYVKYDVSGGLNNGTTWSNAYTSFQSALTVAISGDQIWVAKGTYKPSSPYDLIVDGDRDFHFRMKNGVEIYGGFAGTENAVSERINFGAGQTNETILSGDIGTEGDNTDNCYHVFYHPDGLVLTNSAVLDGFTIKGGKAYNNGPHLYGGGMHNYYSSPTITNCTFTSNSAYMYGGGMYNSSSSPNLTNCTFSSYSDGYGGGIYNESSSPSLTNCTFTLNSVSYGGGMYNSSSSSPGITSCTFTSNSVSHYGGGIANATSSPILTNCTFTSNSAASGGGMYNSSSSSPSITNCTFTSNPANYGGGMFNSSSSSPGITSCTFTFNSASDGGGGMFNYSSASPSLTNCTFSSNSANYGGGMYNESSSTALTNCILWGNEATNQGDEFYIYDNAYTTTLSYSCYANATGDVYIASGTFTATNNNITSDPMFVGSSINPAHPYSIQGTSPCADAGNDSDNLQAYDIRGAGYSRKLNKTTGGVGTIDMGAYEYKLNVDVLPVELTSFTASANGATVMLHWLTATEVNNFGFEIERLIKNEKLEIKNWETIGFIEGNGNSNSPKEYSFTDETIMAGKYSYRLKQIDNDGKFAYSDVVDVDIENLPTNYTLYQNYPNPFNPSTTIKFGLPKDGMVTLEVYNLIGEKVTTLVNKEMSAGYHTIDFNGSNLSSGIYLYKITSEEFTSTKKFVLMK
jgi:hypothetical protein